MRCVMFKSVYIKKRNNLEVLTVRKLFLTTQKLFREASKDSISRWIRTLLSKAGIDSSNFSGNSTRAAASAAACSVGLSLTISWHMSDD